jgi:endonuclease YncB( thermonuclease family)
MRRLVDILTALLLIVVVLVVAARLREEPIVDAEGPFRAVDGDSLESATQRLRLRGIDAPELQQMCGADDTVPCGRNARSALAALTRAGIMCRTQGTDRFGRGLATCEMKTGADVARTLVLAGHAVADGCCSAEEKLARERKAGIWAAPFQRPDEWRDARQESESRRQEP